jgi:hypothetical protein
MFKKEKKEQVVLLVLVLEYQNWVLDFKELKKQ